jgi:hypothetical protein
MSNPITTPKLKFTALTLLISVGLVFMIGSSYLTSMSAAAAGILQIDTFSASKDTYIDEGQPDTNFGAVGLSIGQNGSGEDRYLLLEFDISSIPANAIVISATLELYHVVNLRQAENSLLPNIQADANLSSWTELGATWNSAPSKINLGDPDTNFSGAPGWNAFDVSEIVDAWHSPLFTNRGLTLHGDAIQVGLFGFESRTGTNAPKLHVNYFIPTHTPTGTLPPSSTATQTATPTKTVTPSPTATSGPYSCPGTFLMKPSADTYVSAGLPGQAYGTNSTIKMGVDHVAVTVNWNYLMLKFPIDQIPAGYFIHDAALHLQVRDIAQGQEPPWEFGIFSLGEPFSENTTTWLNQPWLPGTVYGSEPVEGANTHTLDDYYGLEQMVRDWYNGAPNHGMKLVPLGGDYIITYASREDIGDSPELYIRCESEPLPPPPTRTPTPTPTATATATATAAPPSADLFAFKLEITQGIQTPYENSVRLVQGKRTFARLHVVIDEPGDRSSWRTSAALDIYHNGQYKGFILPSDPGGPFGNMQPQATWFYSFGSSFLFEIPSEYTSGELRLVAVVNPDKVHFEETDHSNNSIEDTVSFEYVPELFLRLFLVGYREVGGQTYHYPWGIHDDRLISWLERAYPVPGVDNYTTVFNYEGPTVLSWLDPNPPPPNGGLPDCKSVNRLISTISYWDRIGGVIPDDNTKYYGMVDDEKGFMRGCSSDIPSGGASGPTGSTADRFGWDPDVSYGDWYGGHELGHAYGRHHADYCGADSGGFWVFQPPGYEQYPYSHGDISPIVGTSQNWDFGYGISDLVVGFDYWPAPTVYTPDWKDMMTYCNNQWISDWTYESIMDKMQNNLLLSPGEFSSLAGEPTDRILIAGAINLQTGAIELEPVFILPDATEFDTRIPGDYAIVLRDENKKELARYPFTPNEFQIDGLDADGVSQPEYYLNIFEQVPYVAGTAILEIEHLEKILLSLGRGDAAPVLEISVPQPGAILSENNVTIGWDAYEDDGESMFFNVQYSPDSGETWHLIAQNIMGSSLTISRTNLIPSSKAYFRVWASDGLNTTLVEMDDPISVANSPPVVQIISPTDNSNWVLDQSIGFWASAEDPDQGSLPEDQVSWYSNLDGWLGDGENVTTAGLSVGTHQITVFAFDQHGGVGVANLELTVYSSADDLPAMPDVFTAAPQMVILEPGFGESSKQILLDNLYNPGPIAWTATTSDPWIVLDAYSGTAPNVLQVSVDESLLVDGVYDGTIKISQVGGSNTVHLIAVRATIVTYRAFLPIVGR